MRIISSLSLICVSLVYSVVCLQYPQDTELIRTPFGLSHPACVLGVPSGTHVQHHEKGLYLEYPNGTSDMLEPCPHAAKRSSAAREVLSPPTWNGWVEHFWFGLDYNTRTNPPLQHDVVSFRTDFAVPPTPQVITGNSSAPWRNAPTLSFWIGLQGGYVLQPVLEFNGLVRGNWGLSSWNCCPQGYQVHSDPISGISSGQALQGSIAQTGTTDQYIYDIVSTVVGGKSTTLRADMTRLSGWQPRWTEAIIEGYFVTTCRQLPAQPVKFTNMELVTTAGKVNSIPWKQSFIVENGTAPVICHGTTTVDSTSFDVSVGFS